MNRDRGRHNRKGTEQLYVRKRERIKTLTSSSKADESYYYYYYYYLYLLYIGYSPIFTRTSPRQTMSLGDTLLQLLFRFIVNTLYGAYLPRSYVGSDVFYVSTFRRMCAVPNMAVFCSSRTSWLPGMLPTHFLNDF